MLNIFGKLTIFASTDATNQPENAILVKRVLSLVIKKMVTISLISAKTVISNLTGFALTDATNQPENATLVSMVLSLVLNIREYPSLLGAKKVVSNITKSAASTDATNQPENAILVNMVHSLVMKVIPTSAVKVVSNDTKGVMKTAVILQQEYAKIRKKDALRKVLSDAPVICLKNATWSSGRVTNTAMQAATQKLEDVYIKL